MKRKCSMFLPGSLKEPCPGEGKFAPAMRVWAEGDRKLDPKNSLLLHIDMPLCSKCAQGTELQDVLSDAGFKQIRDAIVGMGRAAPSRQTVQLELESIWDNERVAVFTPEKKKGHSNG